MIKKTQKIKKHIVIMWSGLPYYAVAAIRKGIEGLPNTVIDVISTSHQIEYEDADLMLGKKVIRIDFKKKTNWEEINVAEPDILFTSSWSHPACMSLARQLKASGKRKRVVCIADNIYTGSLRQRVGRIYFRTFLKKIFDYAWVPGRKSKDFLVYLGMDHRTVYEGVYCPDEELFNCRNSESNRTGLLFVGQLIPRKGIKNLLDACSNQWLKKNLTIIGGGELENDVLESSVKYIGRQSPKQLALAYSNALAVILPSVVDHWGMVLSEAAACGCILIATKDCGAAFDLIIHRKNGYILQDNSPECINKSIEWLCSLSNLQISIGQKTSLDMVKSYGTKRFVESLEKLALSIDR
jgi:glycosyltransferase involved in cell wall biosynthesis